MRHLEKERLQNKSKFRTNILYLINGIKELNRSPWKNIILIIYFVFSCLVWKKKALLYSLATNSFIFPLYKVTLNISIATFLILVLLLIIMYLGKPITTRKVHDSFLKIGFINHADETPILISKYKSKQNPTITVLELSNNGIPLAEFQNKVNDLESALNSHIIKISYGRNKKQTILHTVSAKVSLPKKILWKEEYLSKNEFVLTLGESLLGKVEVNLAEIPHILLGGSSGSGKSVLLKLLLRQCIQKSANTYIADFKGGVDFNHWWHANSNVITDETNLLETLNLLVTELENRKLKFRDVGVSNISEFNSSGHSLKRIIFACDEIAEVLDKTGVGKDQKTTIQEIERAISIIARQGRAFGIHLIIANQRPDANILTGQIKSNINYRVCGRADSVLSSIILDNTEASKVIPADSQGLFVNHDNTIFQAYQINN